MFTMHKTMKQDPGAVVHGNFINYYQFNQAEERFRLLPADIWLPKEEKQLQQHYLVLDVGCNTGELTQQLWKHISVSMPHRQVHVLGVDLDHMLIMRAQENNLQNTQISYKCLDIMNEADYYANTQKFLHMFERKKFDAICCFSVTMWIHLNHHDAGLQEMLQRLSLQTDLLLVESQPWKCYQNAQRRLKRANSQFPLFLELKWRSNVEKEIDDYIQNELQRCRVHKTEQTHWQRSIYFYRNIS